jgi:hypothetical protein
MRLLVDPSLVSGLTYGVSFPAIAGGEEGVCGVFIRVHTSDTDEIETFRSWTGRERIVSHPSPKTQSIAIENRCIIANLTRYVPKNLNTVLAALVPYLEGATGYSIAIQHRTPESIHIVDYIKVHLVGDMVTTNDRTTAHTLLRPIFKIRFGMNLRASWDQPVTHPAELFGKAAEHTDVAYKPFRLTYPTFTAHLVRHPILFANRLSLSTLEKALSSSAEFRSAFGGTLEELHRGLQEIYMDIGGDQTVLKDVAERYKDMPSRRAWIDEAGLDRDAPAASTSGLKAGEVETAAERTKRRRLNLQKQRNGLS